MNRCGGRRVRVPRLLALSLTLASAGTLAAPVQAVAQETRYRVQVAASEDREAADSEARRVFRSLEGEYSVHVRRTGEIYAVRVGDFAAAGPARRLVMRTRALGYGDAWLARVREAETVAMYAPGMALIDPPAVRHPTASTGVSAPGTPLDRPLSNRAPLEVPEPEGATPPPPTDAAPPESMGATSPPEPAADSPDPGRDEGASTVKRVETLPVDGGVRVDGRLDDPAWRGARWISEFQQKGKDRGFDPWDSTHVAFVYDDEALYVAGRMWVGDPEHLRALVGGRDAPGNVERLLISLDTYRDRQTAYTFGITAGGTRVDYQHARDNEGWRDDSFDPVWEARAAVDSAGWTAEMRIPFSQLRFNENERPVWGLNVRRWNPATFLNVYWVVVPYHEVGWSSRFGELHGLPPLGASRRVEVMPYLRGGVTLPDSRRTAQGSTNEFETRVGGDLKMGLAPNVTLDATFNPDFGQVEADPAEVNLTQFETFFPEKRPFFLESRHLFRTQGPNYFYSRRIGAVPPGTLPSGVLETPVASTILGAAKVTGRLESGLSLGALAALTDVERVPVELTDPEGAGVSDGEGSEPGEGLADPGLAEVAPRTAFGVARVHKELGPAGSGVGALLTGVGRALPSEGSLSGVLSRTAIAGGVDGALRLEDGLYEVRGYAGFSHVSGDPAAILRQQTSSARYYQRPDATHVTVDSASTTLTGQAAGLSVAKVGGAPWLWSAEVSVRTPGFEIRDAGSQSRADRIDANATLGYGQRGLPRGAIHTYSAGVGLGAGWNFGGVRRHTTPSLFFDVTWRSLLRSVVQLEFGTRALSDDLTRGGPLAGTPTSFGLRAGLTGSPVPLTQWFVNGGAFFDELGGWSGSLDGGVSLRPSPRLGLSVGPGFTLARDSRQYVDTQAGGPAETFGQRYIFSFLDRTEVYAHLRLDYAVTPDLTIELYAEPFAASGRFYDFGELIRPGGRHLRVYGTDGSTIETSEDGSLQVSDGDETFTIWNSDFRLRSFRSNAVLRWEWSRGSSLHLIWQQNRWSSDDSGDRVDPATLFGALGDAGENIFVAKISYWLSLQ